jgi:hypothetical protein
MKISYLYGREPSWCAIRAASFHAPVPLEMAGWEMLSHAAGVSKTTVTVCLRIRPTARRDYNST